jgi:hypothetical protein
MSKKNFIALADMIRFHNRTHATGDSAVFNESHLIALAEFCREQNCRFKRERWLDYINGKCGPNGGAK